MVGDCLAVCPAFLIVPQGYTVFAELLSVALLLSLTDHFLGMLF